jgi:Crinkler effector protein N-terminal domain
MNLGDDDLLLFCLIEGETEPFEIGVKGPSWRNPKFTVGNLKKKIQKERKDDSLKGVGAPILKLWKVRAIEHSRSRIIWLTCHLCSRKRGILSIRNRNRLCPAVSHLLGNLGKN